MPIDYTPSDLEAAKILDSFLPDRIFDAHMHISLLPSPGAEPIRIGDYKRDVLPLFGKRPVYGMALTKPTRTLFDRAMHERTMDFFRAELDANPDFYGSILIKPEETEDEILSHIRHARVRGLKCYHIFSDRERTADADLHEYLSEAALRVANEHEMTVTIHLVKDGALADPVNLGAIKRIAREYPRARLILAHSARAFAAWTVMDAIEELVPFSNIFFDFSAICESPSIIRILKAVGVSRCMWGSDYNVAALLGKAISLGDGFYWIGEEDLARFSAVAGISPIRPRHILLENLMATREAALLAGLSAVDIENLFFGNACHIFA